MKPRYKILEIWLLNLGTKTNSLCLDALLNILIFQVYIYFSGNIIGESIFKAHPFGFCRWKELQSALLLRDSPKFQNFPGALGL